MSDWAAEYFERGYAQRWGLPPVTDRIRSETDALWTHCDLRAGARVADVGCGHGRHALAFAARGASVAGVDSSAPLLDEARRLGRESGLAAQWIRGDMRRVPLRSGGSDTVLVIDAFGFFETDDENEHVLREAARLLRPGGHLALKVLNGQPIVADFRTTAREDRDGVIVSVSRTLSLTPPRMTEDLSIAGARGEGHYERRQRLYRADDVCAAARQAGLSIVGVFADAAGTVFEPATSFAMWVIAATSPN
jgi:SAM-dependent methyltransferase